MGGNLRFRRLWLRNWRNFTSIEVDEQRAVQIEFEADAESDYILYRGETVTQIDLALSDSEAGLLTERIGNESTTFHRVERLPGLVVISED